MNRLKGPVGLFLCGGGALGLSAMASCIAAGGAAEAPETAGVPGAPAK